MKRKISLGRVGLACVEKYEASGGPPVVDPARSCPSPAKRCPGTHPAAARLAYISSNCFSDTFRSSAFESEEVYSGTGSFKTVNGIPKSMILGF